MKKIVIFGGGSGLSQILKGLKLFPLDITAVVSVADNGASTGRLRKDFNIPAVGDISKVMLAMSNANTDLVNLLNYRFTKSKTLGNHSVKNLLLSALLDLKGNFNDSIPIMMNLLDIKGNILPLTEDNAELVGFTASGKKILGEEQITKCASKISHIGYNKEIKINPKVLTAIQEADLIIFSTGSLLTSIAPHLIVKEVIEALRNAKAPKLYICNLFTQPGETDGYTVSQHIDILESYLGKDTIDVVIANKNLKDKALKAKYQTKEQKDPVILDEEVLQKRNVLVIADNLAKIEDNVYRHDSLKTAYLIFSYLMDSEASNYSK